MKTLNEVIKANECCDHGEPDSRCEDCPYNGIGACCAERESDALHYLKEYKKYTDTMCALPDYYEWVHSIDNPPLTWDELKQMEWKPVWVEVDGKWWGRFWAFVEVANDAYVNFYQKGQEYPEDLWKRDIGKTWQAYRKERNETN